MNANELADKSFMELWESYTSKKMECDDLEEKLRQQALEIQALHQILGYEGVEVGQDYLDECVIELRKAQEK